MVALSASDLIGARRSTLITTVRRLQLLRRSAQQTILVTIVHPIAANEVIARTGIHNPRFHVVRNWVVMPLMSRCTVRESGLRRVSPIEDAIGV